MWYGIRRLSGREKTERFTPSRGSNDSVSPLRVAGGGDWGGGEEWKVMEWGLSGGDSVLSDADEDGDGDGDLWLAGLGDLSGGDGGRYGSESASEIESR